MTSLAIGRILGASMCLTFVISLLSNFKLQSDLFTGGGLLVNAAAHPMQIGLICVLGLFTGLVSLGIGLLVRVHLRERAPFRLDLYAALLIVGFAVSFFEYTTLLAFGELSEAFTKAAGTGESAFAAAAKALAGLRNGVHFLDKCVSGVGVFVFFQILWSLRLVPRIIAGLGMLAAPAQMVAIGRALFGFDVMYPLLAPLALTYLVTMGWLMVRGFPEPNLSRATQAAA